MGWSSGGRFSWRPVSGQVLKYSQLDDALVLLLVVAGERKGKTDASAVAVEVEHDLFDPARLRDEEVDVLDLDAAFRQPGRRIRHKAPKRGFALDAPAHRVMHLWHAHERLEERVDLSRHQAVEEGHRSEALTPVLVQDPLQRGTGEQLRRERHAATPRLGHASVGRLEDPARRGRGLRSARGRDQPRDTATCLTSAM